VIVYHLNCIHVQVNYIYNQHLLSWVRKQAIHSKLLYGIRVIVTNVNFSFLSPLFRTLFVWSLQPLPLLQPHPLSPSQTLIMSNTLGIITPLGFLRLFLTLKVAISLAMLMAPFLAHLWLSLHPKMVPISHKLT